MAFGRDIRSFAKNVPHWLEKVPSKKTNDPILLLIDRWALVNRQIASYKDSNPYFLAKFETLFRKIYKLQVSKLTKSEHFLD